MKVTGLLDAVGPTTTTPTAPARCDGVRTVIRVSSTTCTFVPGVPSNVTPVAPVKFDPEIVTVAPPAVEPDDGERVAIDGGGTGGGL